MSSLDDAILAAAACVIIANHHRGPRRHWVRPSLQARSAYSGSKLLEDLKKDDRDPSTGNIRCDGSFKNFLRMTSTDFEFLLCMVGHKFTKQDTNYRKAIPVREKLAVTLRFLASGDSYASLSYLFKMSKSTISLFVPEVCEALIDFLKDNVKLQVEPIRKGDHEAKYRSILQAFRLIVREEGPLSLWKGHVPAQVLSLSYGVFQFGVYEALVQQARSVPMLADDKAKVEFVCGYTAGSMATILSFPFDIVRTRLIVQGNNKMYSGMIHGMRHILRTEGLRGWWRGLTPTLLQVGPLSGVQFATYNFFKRMFGNIAWLGEGKAGSLSVYGSLSAGFLAGLAAKATTYPLDLVRRRIQLQGFQQGRIGFGKNFTCNSLLHCVRETVRGEHLTGLFKGLLPSLLKASIVSALIFSVYEKTHQVLCDIHEKSRQQKKQ